MTKILQRLDELGLADNTLVIFTSDHGEMLGDHGMHSKNIFYEGSVHVPLLLRLTDFSKKDAVTIERANQIRQKWAALEQARKSEAIELLKLREQGMKLLKPFTDELWPKNEEFVYKLKPYRDKLQNYEHQKTVGAFIFWPALWFALVSKRTSSSSNKRIVEQ